MRQLVAYLVGLVFALGLGIGGMTQPARVLGFLDVAGPWDPALAFVMAAAVAVYAVAARLAARLERPVYAAAFALPTRRDLDPPLVIGAALFGVGWGLAGLCPGPALTALASGAPAALVFVAAMLAGMVVAGLVQPRAARVPSSLGGAAPSEGRARVARRVALAGLAGGLAMIPVGLVIRHLAGGSVNVYGELVVERLLGVASRPALVAEHVLVSLVLALPLVLAAGRVAGRFLVGLGVAYGAAIWLVLNSLALPWAFGRATPWTLGWAAIWPSLTVHVVYGLAAASSLRER